MKENKPNVKSWTYSHEMYSEFHTYISSGSALFTSAMWKKNGFPPFFWETYYIFLLIID